MSSRHQTVVGIDVGGEKKGFHAVALRDGVFEKATSINPAEIVEWCLAQKAQVVAVDAPCGWSQSGRSRQAERDLRVGEARIQCFILTNIDFIDAALCAVAAEAFRHGRTKHFGNQAEGFIVLPQLDGIC